MLLVTTALEKTWGQTQQILFLGEWCKLYGRKKVWQAREYQTLEYNWGNKELLKADYEDLTKLYERFLPELAATLNRIHGTSHSEKYWRILVGPWLGFFIQILYQRWSSITKATDDFDITNTILLTDKEFYLVPNDMQEFATLFSGDEWNHYICGQIIRQQNKIKYSFLNHEVVVQCINSESKRHSFSRGSKKLSLDILNGLLSPFKTDTDFFFIATGLPKVKEFILKLRLGQLPQYFLSDGAPQICLDVDRRQWKIEGFSHSNFESFLRKVIPSQIPKVYIEGYALAEKLTTQIRWPKSPKIIFTAVGHVYDDLVKNYIAAKVEQGSCLVIGQHGGGSFHAINFQTEHELTICNLYLSPGDGNVWHPKVRDVGQIFARDWNSDPKGSGLLMQLDTPRFSYSISSTTQSDDFNKYLIDQFSFVDALPSKIRDCFIVRLHAADSGRGQKMQWKERFPSLVIDDGHQHVHSLFAKSKLIVCTYAGTTYNQTLAANAPTVIFWNAKYEQLHETAKPLFNELIRVGIFHRTPESAAAHVTRVWSDVAGWWGSADLQEVREKYCRGFASLPVNSLDLVASALNNMS